MRDQLLHLDESLKGVFLRVMEATDDEVLAYLYERQDAKIKDQKDKQPGGAKR